MPNATSAAPDLTTLARLYDLGLVVVGQRMEPERAVLACRVVATDRLSSTGFDGGCTTEGTTMVHLHQAATSCMSISAGLACQSYRFGHHVHFIHTDRLGQTPWGWRDAVVTAVAADGFIDVAYVAEDGAACVWHHRDLTAEIAVGVPVRVHEGYPALSGGFGIVNVSIAGGLGPVPGPEHPQAWAPEMSVGVVDLLAGRGIDLGAVDAEEQS